MFGDDALKRKPTTDRNPLYSVGAPSWSSGLAFSKQQTWTKPRFGVSVGAWLPQFLAVGQQSLEQTDKQNNELEWRVNTEDMVACFMWYGPSQFFENARAFKLYTKHSFYRTDKLKVHSEEENVMCLGEENCLQSFEGKSWRKETTGKT